MDKDDNSKIETIVLNNVFYNKPLYLYIFKKVTKICQAAYLITDLIKDSEPLKWSLRKSVTNTISSFSGAKDIMLSFKEISSDYLTLKSLLEISKNHLLISEMNHLVLEKELNEVIFLINKELVMHASLPQDFFEVPMPDPKEFGRESIRQTSHNPTGIQNYESQGYNHKGHYKRQNEDMSLRKPHQHNDYLKDSNGDARKNRREQILNIIKTKGDLTIKDITSIIKDCSEKTIQRELLDLVERGLVKKEGERRWSTYSLK